MLIFYLIAAGLVLMAILIWLSVLRIEPSLIQQEQQALAEEQIATQRLRLKELAHERQVAALDEEEYQAAVNETKRQLLFDLQQTEHVEQLTGKNPLLIAGVLFILLFISAFYYTNGAGEKLLDWQQAKAALPQLGQRALQEQGSELSPQELQQFVLGLRTKLHETGDDVNAWVVLARATIALNDLNSALLAFEKAYRINPEKPMVLAGYAQMLLMTGEDFDVRRAAILVDKLLRLQPTNLDGLMMMGYIAEQMGELDKAQVTWQLLQQQLAADDPRLTYIQQKLADIATSTGAKINSSSHIQVELQLADEFMDKIPTDAILFVYAKAVNGPPMPAAVVKLSEFNFPISVELSDNDAMIADYKLSSLEQAIVWARLSKDSDISVSAGEFQGKSLEFNVKETHSITVFIDQML